jgi:TonB family protein
MKYLAFMSLILLLALGIVGVSAEAQRRRHSHPRAQVAKTSGIQEIDFGTPAERDRIIAECETPDRPKPATEAEIKIVSQLCGKAISLPKPSYPEGAKEAKASGLVQVDVIVDEKGRVIWAKAVTGHPLLKEESRKAACRARYSPWLISGHPVKTRTSITYNFLPQ